VRTFFAKIKEDKEYQEKLLPYTTELLRISLDALGELERVAFFCNVYHCLTIHGFAESKFIPACCCYLDLGTKSPITFLQKLPFLKTTCYRIGNMGPVSLHNIEHHIMRAKSSKPTLFGISLVSTKVSSEIAAYALQRPLPEVSFILNTGMCLSSAPTCVIYSAKDISLQIARLTENYLTSQVQWDDITTTVSI
jgi:hypothetical protein